MSKSALCISAIDRFKPMSEWITFMVDRDICEKDTSTLQVLPYITLVDENGLIFAYTRGKKGQEARLHNLKSIGVGGHIDEPVTTTLEDLVVREAIREIEEEVGYSPDVEMVRQAFNSCIIIYSPETPVDAVHIAIAMVLRVKRADLTKLEAGVIIKPEWITPHDLGMHASIQKFVKPECMQWTFETWSRRFLEINSTQETFAAHRAQRAEEQRAFNLSNTVMSHIEKMRLLVGGKHVRYAAQYPFQLELSESGQDGDWVKVVFPLDCKWERFMYDASSMTYRFSERTDGGAVVSTKDFVEWETFHEDQISPESVTTE